ncbi:hypothetical protein [Rivularia sp. UHCC 0363]|uniref:hypothetical protein n=1 Tax=Rivularia sp. UHCC 0363 TaxID=3110244 RepID=UPI002B1F2086|nr:hypothetical protein [Rivularia sp. UHCC 0363]MEA5594091.1 hypothetical protein [Rivularia sp. UHCC 0363]
MKRILTALAITSIAITAGCASKVSSSPTVNNNTTVADVNPHEGHNMGGSMTPETKENPHGGHGGHSSDSKLEAANATTKLTVPDKINVNTPVALGIDIKDRQGKSIANFDKFQEKLMHLIVVSDDFESFNHIHPTYKGNGRFEVQADFPKPGGYTLFSDYKVAGKAEQVSTLTVQVPGTNPSKPKIDLATNKTFGNTKANLKLSQPNIKAGQEVHLIFNLLDANSNQPPNDLQNYLGEKGHLVILKQSAPLTEANYIHAHALRDTPPGEIHFITSFPQPGKYKMWGQFNRNGKIVTADYWVDVQ